MGGMGLCWSVDRGRDCVDQVVRRARPDRQSLRDSAPGPRTDRAGRKLAERSWEVAGRRQTAEGAVGASSEVDRAGAPREGSKAETRT